MQTEAMFAQSRANAASDPVQDDTNPKPSEARVVVFVRPGRPPLRVRARSVVSARRCTVDGECSIVLWERVKGGYIVAVQAPFHGRATPDLVFADTIEEAAEALERIASGGLDGTATQSSQIDANDLLTSLEQIIRYRAAAQTFGDLVSEFFSLLGSTVEVCLPGPCQNGE